MNLTEIQIEFLLNNFFKNEKFPGWRNIATNLLKKGECVVAGEGCIWKGGVGNFIKTSVADGFFGCTLYKFDLENFLTSTWVSEVLDAELKNVKEELHKLHTEITDLEKLNK